MKRMIITIAIAVLTAHNLSAQTTAAGTTQTDDSLQYKKNSWYIEFAGASLLGMTINYERFLGGHPWGFSVRAGIGGGIVPEIFTDKVDVYVVFPVGLSYNIPVSASKRNMIEVGGVFEYVSGLPANTFDTNTTHFYQGVVSWRYESSSHRTQFRASIYPNIVTLDNGHTGLFPWVGFSIGQKF